MNRSPESYCARTSRVGGALMILSYPVSVSLSQFGLLLAILGWAAVPLERRLRGAADLAPPPALRTHPALLAALAVYGFILLSLVINALFAPDSLAFFLRGARTELKDAGLLGAAFWTLAHAADPEGRARIGRWLKYAIGILLASGFLSIWSKFRLSKLPYHLTHGWEASGAARFQHHLGTLFADSNLATHFYMPIGFMNTHLTYAAMLAFALPLLFLRVADPFMHSPRALLTRQFWIKAAPLAVALLIFVLNNGRSALIGAAAATLIGAIYFMARWWGKRSLLLLPTLLVAALALVAVDRVSPHMHYRFERVIGALLGEKKHTDGQRVLVWAGSLKMIEEHPLIGAGAGAYTESIDRDIERFGREHPRLWPEYSFAQRGHAHNDMLHLTAIAGPGALLAYLAMFFFFLQSILTPGAREYWKFGPLALLFAGFFQCYFQDDETLLPFWIYFGFALACAPRPGATPAETPQ